MAVSPLIECACSKYDTDSECVKLLNERVSILSNLTVFSIFLSSDFVDSENSWRLFDGLSLPNLEYNNCTWSLVSDAIDLVNWSSFCVKNENLHKVSYDVLSFCFLDVNSSLRFSSRFSRKSKN